MRAQGKPYGAEEATHSFCRPNTNLDHSLVLAQSSHSDPFSSVVVPACKSLIRACPPIVPPFNPHAWTRRSQPPPPPSQCCPALTPASSPCQAFNHLFLNLIDPKTPFDPTYDKRCTVYTVVNSIANGRANTSGTYSCKQKSLEELEELLRTMVYGEKCWHCLSTSWCLHLEPTP